MFTVNTCKVTPNMSKLIRFPIDMGEAPGQTFVFRGEMPCRRRARCTWGVWGSKGNAHGPIHIITTKPSIIDWPPNENSTGIDSE